MRQIAPTSFAFSEAERRHHKRQKADAYRRRQEREVEEWKQHQHTVMEIVGDDPTGLIVEMLGADILRKNSEMLTIYLSKMGNWNSYGEAPKPRLRKFITPREFRIKKFNGRKAALKAGAATTSCRVILAAVQQIEVDGSMLGNERNLLKANDLGRDVPTRVHFP